MKFWMLKGWRYWSWLEIVLRLISMETVKDTIYHSQIWTHCGKCKLISYDEKKEIIRQIQWHKKWRWNGYWQIISTWRKRTRGVMWTTNRISNCKIIPLTIFIKFIPIQFQAINQRITLDDWNHHNSRDDWWRVECKGLLENWIAQDRVGWIHSHTDLFCIYVPLPTPIPYHCPIFPELQPLFSSPLGWGWVGFMLFYVDPVKLFYHSRYILASNIIWTTSECRTYLSKASVGKYPGLHTQPVFWFVEMNPLEFWWLSWLCSEPISRIPAIDCW